jgi:ribonuclease HII
MPRRIDPDLIPPRPDLRFEEALWGEGIEQVAGIDEAGRGALAGPVVAAALILPPDPAIRRSLDGVRDSKQMTPKQRDSWAGRLREVSLAWAVGFASSQEIDALGIIPATRQAAYRALQALAESPAHLLLDYLVLPDVFIPQTSLVKGDARSLTIAAASIIAKTTRDSFMCELNKRYPGYSFEAHKGYGTTYHRGAIVRLGPSPVHRMTFAPLRCLEGSV